MTTAERKKLEEEVKTQRASKPATSFRKQLEAEVLSERKMKATGIDLPATLKDERTAQPQSIMARIDADIVKGRQAEAVKRAKIQAEQTAQNQAIAALKIPHVSDINRSAANVDYAPEIKAAEKRYVAENPVMTPLQRFEANAQKYNPLAIGDMLISKVGAGVAQFGADVADSVVASVKGREDSALMRYISNAHKMLKQVTTGKTDYPSSTANDTANWDMDKKQKFYLGNTLQDKAESYTAKLDNKYADLTDNAVTKAMSDLATSTGYMIPVAISNAIIPNSGIALLYASGFSSGERQALQNGSTPEDATLYGLLNGLNQSAGELLIGGVLGQGKGIVNALLKKTGLDIVSKITNPALRNAAGFIANAIGEGVEEAVQGGLDVAAQRATYKPDAKIDPAGLAYEGLLGAGMGAVFGVGNAVKGLTLPSVNDATESVKQNFADKHNAFIRNTELRLNTNLRDVTGDEMVAKLQTAKTPLERTGILSGASDEVIKQVATLQAASKLEFEFFNESSADGYIKNGFTQNGKIYLNAQSSKTVPWILAHELSDNLENTKSFGKLQALVKSFEGDKFNQKRAELIADYKQGGVELSETEADREIISNYSGDNLFTNYDAIYNVVKTDRTLGEKIRSWISGMITKLTGTAEEKYLLKARELYSKALSELRDSEKVIASKPVLAYNGANETGGAKMSVSKTDPEKQKLIDDYNALRDKSAEANKKFRELTNSAEYLALMDKAVQPQKQTGSRFNKSVIPVDMPQDTSAMDAVAKWESDNGIKDLMEQKSEYEKQIKSANKAIEDYENVQYEKTIEESGLTKADWHRKEAVKEFGYTPYFYDTGYILPDGKTLNFSGEKGKHYGSRGQDHRGISAVFNADSGGEAMIEFMSEGNIRLMAETPGVDIISNVEPTTKQYATIRAFVREYAPKEEFFSIDFTDTKGNVVDSITYEYKVSAEKVINDISYFYANGKVPVVSDIQKFRYSISKADDESYMTAVNNGDTETAQKMVDEAAKKAGYNVKAYHGTTAKKFNEFAANSYFSPKYEFAEQYSHVLQADGTNEPKVYSVYLQPGNVKKVPFATVTREAYAILDKAKRNTMLERQPLYESGIPEYIVKNPNQTKSADPVTYDDSGNVIPLSKRFDSGSNDIRYSISKADSDGNELSEEQQEYFADTKAVDEGGALKVVYHGTNSDKEFTMFDTYGSKYGLYGLGSYFTEDRSVAEKYTKKGRGHNPRVYEAYVNITNPIDMDADADIEAWEKALAGEEDMDFDFSKVKTNTDAMRMLEKELADNDYVDWEGAEYVTGVIQGMGYDGITHIGGQIFDGVKHRVWIAYEPDQIKSIDNKSPTHHGDIRFSITEDDNPDADYFRKRANSANTRKTQDVDSLQAPPPKKRVTPTATDDERAAESATIAHAGLKAIIADIDAKYAERTAIVTKEAQERLDIIIAQEDAKSFAPISEDAPDNAEAEAIAERELSLPYVMAEGNEKLKEAKLSAEEHAKIVLMTEAEALLKNADPIRKDIKKYQDLKRDYRATVKGRNSNPDEISESEVIDAADKMDKARDVVLNKLEKRDASVEQSVKDGTFADIMQKQYDKLKQLRKVKGEDAKYKAEALKAYISDINRRRKAMLYKLAEDTVGEVTAWTDKKMGIQYQRETLERNIRDTAPNKTIADNMIKAYRRPIDQNERKNNIYKTEYRDKVRVINMSSKKAGNNKNSERSAVQFVGEYDYLISASGSKPDVHGKTKTDYEAELQEYISSNPDFNYDDIRAKAKQMHTIYDEIFKQINKTLLENGYPPVDYRKGYFPHFSEDKPDTLLGKLAMAIGINAAPDTLPTSINGLTYQFKPGKRWMANLQRRTGLDTEYDAVKGFDSYIEGASDIIHHTADIQRLRALSEHIRTASADKKLKEQAKLIRADDTKTAEEQHESIEKLFKETKYALSNFTVDLDEFTNQLANKKARADRDVEQAFNRSVYNFMKAVEQQVAANMVGGNPRSWTTNFIPIHQAAAQISNKNMIYGMLSTLKAAASEDNISSASAFLINRKGSDPLVKTGLQSARDIISKPMQWIDDFASNTIVRARYYHNTEKGMPFAEALDEADAFANSVMTGRSKGSTPTLFGAKNPLIKPFTQFQIEVNNQWSYLLKDLPREQKEKGTAMFLYALLKFIIGAYLFDDLYEWIIGTRPAFDPLDVVNQSVGDFTGYELPNTFDLAKTMLFEKRLPVKEDFQNEKTTIRKAGANTAKRVAEELPFIGGFLGGGRLPVQAAIPNFANLWNAGSGFLDGTTDGKKTAAVFIKELSNPLFYLALPMGGGQVKKTIEGVSAVNKRGSWTMDNEGNDILQYPVTNNNLLTYAQAAVIGKSTLPSARDWIDSDFKNLSKSASETYAALIGMGEDEKVSYDIIKDLSDTKKTDTESQDTVQRDKLVSAPISGSMKYEMYYRMLASKSDQKTMDALTDAKLSESKAFDTIVKYKDLNVSKAKVGEKALDWQRWVDKQGFSATQKAAIDEYMSFRVALPVEPTAYEKFTESGMDVDSAYEVASTLSDLEPLEGKDTVSNVQKYRAIADMDVDNKVKLKAFGAIMSESGYEKLFTAVRSGVPMKTFVSYLEAIGRIDSDLEDGKTVSGSKRLKILTLINSLPISDKQKDKMYLLSGYSEDEISDAVWRGGEAYKGNVYAVKVNGRVVKVN